MGLLSFFKGLFGGASGSSSDFIGGWYAKALREPITGGLPIKPKLLVIHFTAGASAESSISYWRKLSNGICAHFVIDRNGAIFQCRPCDVACGHAGRSSWELKKSGLKLSGLNAHSIGIELANGGSTFPAAFLISCRCSPSTRMEAQPRSGSNTRLSSSRHALSFPGPWWIGMIWLRSWAMMIFHQGARLILARHSPCNGCAANVECDRLPGKKCPPRNHKNAHPRAKWWAFMADFHNSDLLKPHILQGLATYGAQFEKLRM